MVPGVSRGYSEASILSKDGKHLLVIPENLGAHGIGQYLDLGMSIQPINEILDRRDCSRRDAVPTGFGPRFV